MIKRVIVGFFVFIMCFITVINFKTPMIGEDFALSIPYRAKSIGAVDKLPLIAEKIINQSTTWNARFGEQLAILFLAFDKSLFNVFNTFAIFLLFYLMLSYKEGKLAKLDLKNLVIFCVIFLVFLLLPGSGDILFWLTVSCNYLWGTLLILISLWPVRTLLSGEDYFEGKSLLTFILFLGLAFLAGTSSESSVPVALLIIAISYVYLRVRGFPASSVSKWYYVYPIALLFGYAYLILSPSTVIRRQYYLTVFGVQQLNFEYYLSRLIDTTRLFAYSTEKLLYLIGIVSIISAAVSIIKRRGNNKQMVEGLYVMFIYLVCSFFGILVVSFAPYTEVRSFLFIWIWLLTFMAFLLDFIIDELGSVIFVLVFFCMITVALIKLPMIYNCYKNYGEQLTARHYEIVRALEEGNRDIKIRGIELDQNCRYYISERESWLADFLHDEIFYGLESIRIIN